MRGTSEGSRLRVAMLLFLIVVKIFFADVRTRIRACIHTELPRSSKPPLLLPSPPLRSTRDTRTHRFLDVCFLVVRAHAALRTIPTTPSTHFHRRTSLATPTLSPPTPNSRAARHATPQEATLIISIFPIRLGGGKRACNTLPHPLLLPYHLHSHPSDRLHHPLTCTPFSGGWPKEKYLYLSVSSRTTSPYPLFAPTPVLPFSPRLYSPPPP